jgi:hypothetical protein
MLFVTQQTAIDRTIVTDETHSVGPYKLSLEDYRAIRPIAPTASSEAVSSCYWMGFSTLGFVVAFTGLSCWIAIQFLGAQQFRAYVPAAPMALIVLGGLLHAFVVFRILTPGAALASFRKQEIGNSSRVVTISPDGIIARSEDARTTMPWSFVTRIVVTPERLFLYVTAATAVTIPKSAFKSADDFAVFEQAANAWWSKSKQA